MARGCDPGDTCCLSSRPRCSREADAVSPGADNIVSGNFHRWGRTEIHFCLSDTVEMYMPPLLLDWPRIFCYENRTDSYGDLRAGKRP
ncbi:hypothetical protein SBA7_60010 [Candidatus Sulfotelmatobacter sp. SbA7]|nr:hypothetical protein SBA7_60010 [Candidatus Sulfotelmatobacter sp. SbA7]